MGCEITRMPTNYSGQRVLILGAGVTGNAIAKSLSKRGAEISFLDQNQNVMSQFPILLDTEIKISEWDYIVTSPGWNPEHRIIKIAIEAGKEILNEIDIAWDLHQEIYPSQKWLALTGTNGKTTTVEMAASMIREEGLSAIACGNVGETVISCVDSSERYDYLVIELSSFQLFWSKKAQFVSSAILNIADDHTDWHGTFENYANSKISILDRSTTAILNSADTVIVSKTAHWQGRKVFFTLDTPRPGEIGVVEDLLVDRAFVADPQEAVALAQLTDVTPTVPHNVSNALAAAGLARSVGVSHEAITRALQNFKPGRHRIELVTHKDGISFVDDSKATNPHAAMASLMSHLSVIWIAGGLAKGAKMEELVLRCKGRIKAAVLIGSDRALIADALHANAPDVQIVEIDPPTTYRKDDESNLFMENIVKVAKELATEGDVVLLAPACASMDQFVSYSDRGDRFALAVKKVVLNE